MLPLVYFRGVEPEITHSTMKLLGLTLRHEHVDIGDRPGSRWQLEQPLQGYPLHHDHGDGVRNRKRLQTRGIFIKGHCLNRVPLVYLQQLIGFTSSE